MAQLYATHVPTTVLQKGLLAVGSAAIALINPLRAGLFRQVLFSAEVHLVLHMLIKV